MKLFPLVLSNTGAWLTGLTLLAAGLRVIGLNGGLWWDEIYALLDSVRPPLREILTTFGGDNQHPLYAILAHLSSGVFGEHSWSLRLPAALFGVASIPLIYRLGARVASRREGLFAALLLAVSYHHVWFSQNARGYTALVFWTLLCTDLLISGIRAGRCAPFVGYAVAAALGAYTHLTFVFIVASHALICAWLLLRPGRRGIRLQDWRPPLLGFGLAAALALLLYAPILSQVLDFFLHHPSRLRGVSTPAWAFWETLRGLRIGLGGAAGLLAGGLLAGCGLWSYFKQDRLALALFLLPGAVAALGGLAARGTMYPRYFFFLIGFALLILVRGTLVLARWIASRRSTRPEPAHGRALGAALVGAMTALSAVSLIHNYRYPKQDFEGAMRFVEAHRSSGEVVVTAGFVTTFPYQHFYGRAWQGVESVEELREVRERGRRVWLLYTFPRYIGGDLLEAIRREFAVVEVFRGTLGGGDVVVARAEAT